MSLLTRVYDSFLSLSDKVKALIATFASIYFLTTATLIASKMGEGTLITALLYSRLGFYVALALSVVCIIAAQYWANEKSYIKSRLPRYLGIGKDWK